MAATVTDSVAIGAADNVSTLETATLTPTGANKKIFVCVGSGAGTPVNPSSVKYASSAGTGGESLTLLDSVRDIGANVKTSTWVLSTPSASSGTIWVDWGGNQDERWIIAAALQDAGTVGTPVYASGTTGSINATVTVTVTSTTSGNLVIGGFSCINFGASGPVLTAGQTSIKELDSGSAGTTGIGPYETAGMESTVAAGSSTALTWTIDDASTEWGFHGVEIATASGGASHATSGALTGAGAAVAGTANRVKVHTSSGALTGAGASVAGTANRVKVHASTGELTGAGATVSGTANRVKVHTSTGALTGAGADIDGVASNGAPGARTALDFPSNGGSPSAFVAMYLDGADLPDIAPITVIDRYYPIQHTGFYTKFFHSRGDGTFAEKYFGTHPYPVGGSSGTVHNWEISIDGTDIIVDENAYDTTVTKGRWYRQASVGENRTGLGEVDYYWDLDAGIDRIINHRSIATLTNATTSPKLTYGDAWWSQQQERLSGYLRGIQIYQEALSTTHIQALSLLETDAEVLAYCSTNSITSLWYLNMNPTASDVTDKSGNGRDMQWASGSTAGTFFLPGEFAATGALVGAGSAVAGTANRVKVHATSGALVGAGAAVSGVASSAIEHATSGALTGAGAAVAGSANRVKVHPTTGVLSGAGAAVAGEAERSTVGSHATTGELIGAGATIDGSATRLALHETSGALVGAGALVAGTAVHNSVHDAAGVLIGSVAQLVGLASLNGASPSTETFSGGSFANHPFLRPPRLRKPKQDDDEEEVRQRALLELAAIEHAIETARKTGKKSSFAQLSLEDIASRRAIAKMAIEDRIALQAKIEAVQRKQRIMREDDELMQLF